MSDMTVEKAQALLDGATPGPWRWEENHPTNACANVLAKTEGGWDVDIATLYGNSDDVPSPTMPDEPWGDHPIRRATAQLCAAAPDLARAYITQAAEITRLTKWRAEEGEKIKRQAKALTELKQHRERVKAERDGLARKVAEVQRSGDDLAHSELADLQARVHNQRQEIVRLAVDAAELTRLRAKVAAADKLAEALTAVVPGHRDPEGMCWCGYGSNPDYGHSIACVSARVALSAYEGAKE